MERIGGTRLPCPPLSPRVCSNSCPLSQKCLLTISSSAALFSSYPQSSSTSGSFPISHLFGSSGQSIGASVSVLPMNIQGLFPLGLTDFILLAVQWTLTRLVDNHKLLNEWVNEWMKFPWTQEQWELEDLEEVSFYFYPPKEIFPKAWMGITVEVNWESVDPNSQSTVCGKGWASAFSSIKWEE